MNQFQELKKRFESAKGDRQVWEGLFDEAYKYALTQRPGFFTTDLKTVSPENRADQVYDATVANAAEELAGHLQEDLFPSHVPWVEFQAMGQGAMQSRSTRDNLKRTFNRALRESAFDAQIYEAMLDATVSTGILRIESGDGDIGINIRSVPLTHVYLDTGPKDEITGIYYRRQMSMDNIVRQYGIEAMPALFRQQYEGSQRDRNPNTSTKEVIVCTHKGRSYPVETWHEYVIIPEYEAVISHSEMEGTGSCPWIIFRWSKAAGEVYGRGPVLKTLPDVRTLNYVIEFMLENADMAIAGIWQTDDVDHNANNVRIFPGAVIPRNPMNTGLQPLQSPSNFDLSQFIIAEWRQRIEIGMLKDPFGPGGRTPASATEVQERRLERDRKLAAVTRRAEDDIFHPLVARILYILRAKGTIPDDTIPGEHVQAIYSSPMVKQKGAEGVVFALRYMESIAAIFGPEGAASFVHPYRYSRYIADGLSVPTSVLKTEQEIQQEQQQQMEMMAAQQAQQAQQQGGGGQMPQ